MCINSARTDLWRGRLARGVPTPSLWLLLEYERFGSPKTFLLCLVGILFCVSGHKTAVFYLAPALFIFLLKESSRRWSGWHVVASLLLLLVLVAPLLGQMRPSYIGWTKMVPAFLSLACVFSILIWHAARKNWDLIWRVCVFGLAAGIFLVLVAGKQHLLLLALSQIFSANSSLVAERIGLVFTPRWWDIEGYVLLSLLGIGLFSTRQHFREEKAYFLWLALPLIALFVSVLWMSKFHSYWSLVLFPAAWLGVAKGLVYLGGRLTRWYLGNAMVVLVSSFLLWTYCSRSMDYQRHVELSGGVGKRGPTLHTKTRVLERIASRPGASAIFMMVIPYGGNPYAYDIDNWSFLFSHYFSTKGPHNVSDAKNIYYLFQKQSQGSNPELREKLHGKSGISEETIGSIVLYRSDKLIEGAGTRFY